MVHQPKLRSSGTTGKSALAGSLLLGNFNPALENSVRNRRPLVRRQVPASDLVFFNPQHGRFPVGQIDGGRSERDVKAVANFQSVVAVKQDAVPDHQSVPATFGDDIVLKLAAFVGSQRRNKSLKFRVNAGDERYISSGSCTRAHTL
jgi:hypothetical protein